MAGPRYLGINNVIDPTEGARRALSEVGAIYRDYDEQARRNEESARQREEYARLTNERKVLSEYNPTVGDNFFGIDMDTQNHVRQAEARAIERNNALRASGDASALSDEALQQTFLTNRSQLADRDTVFRDVYNDLVSRNVSDESAQRRATIAASGYGATSALAAAEQAAVDARNAMAVERAKLIAGYDKADATNLTNLTRTAISANNRGSGSGSGSGGKSSSSGSTSKSPYPTPDAMQKIFESAGDMSGSSDGKKAIQSLISGIDLMQKAADKEYQEAIKEARKNGTSLSDVPLPQVPDWETIQREFTGTFRPNWLNDRFAYNTPEDVVVDFLKPIQQRMELQAEVARTSRPSASGSGGAGGGRISLDSVMPIQANRAAVLEQPAVARQLTELNRDRVNRLYGQYMEEAPQATPNRAPADIRTSSPRVSTSQAAPQTRPQARPQAVPQTSPESNRSDRTLGTPPPAVRAANENTRATQPESVSVAQTPGRTDLTPAIEDVSRSVIENLDNLTLTQLDRHIAEGNLATTPNLDGLDSEQVDLLQKAFNQLISSPSRGRREEIVDILKQEGLYDRVTQPLEVLKSLANLRSDQNRADDELIARYNNFRKQAVRFPSLLELVRETDISLDREAAQRNVDRLAQMYPGLHEAALNASSAMVPGMGPMTRDLPLPRIPVQSTPVQSTPVEEAPEEIPAELLREYEELRRQSGYGGGSANFRRWLLDGANARSDILAARERLRQFQIDNPQVRR